MSSPIRPLVTSRFAAADCRAAAGPPGQRSGRRSYLGSTLIGLAELTVTPDFPANGPCDGLFNAPTPGIITWTRDRGHHFRSLPDCPSRGAGQLTKGPARLSSRPRLSSRRRCDLPPFHALAARRTLAGCMRHKAAVRTKTTSRAKGIARHTPKMTSSHRGMTAIRLRTTLRTTITGWYSPTRYLTVSLR